MSQIKQPILRAIPVSFIAFLLGLVFVQPRAQGLLGEGSSTSGVATEQLIKAYAVQGSSAISYRASGSGDGIRALTERRTDFALVDFPLSRSQLDQMGLRQFPVFLTPVVIAVNLPGIANNQLRFDADILAQIYQGKITRWNDPRIAANNRGLSLPDRQIVPLHRADNAGGSYIFTRYLTAAAPGWKEAIGIRPDFRPLVSQAKEAVGASALVQLARATDGAIVYLSFASAVQSGLSLTQLRNQWGNYVSPGIDVFEQTARLVEWERTTLDEDRGGPACLNTTQG